MNVILPGLLSEPQIVADYYDEADAKGVLYCYSRLVASNPYAVVCNNKILDGSHYF